MEKNTGTLKPVNVDVKYIENLCIEDWLTRHDYFSIDDPDDWRELLQEAFWDDIIDIEVVEINDQWYEVHNHVKTDNLDHQEVDKQEDGTFKFSTVHYNGGAHWTELVENELKKI